MRGGSFLTAFYGILESRTGRLRYVNAGHNPPMMISKLKSKSVDKLKSTGMALGVAEEATWQQRIISFAPGDVLVMYTGGITAAHNNEGDLFSEPRLLAGISNQSDRPAAEILDAILAEINSFTAGAPDQDDMAIVVLSRTH
jgi:sigma-B regulation protein RsbU (phosphoserine phosphatase)